MTSARPYRAPYRSIIILTALIAAYFTLVLFFYGRRGVLSREVLVQLLVPGIITVVVLSAEAYIYWYLRKRIIRKLWAVMHILFLYFSLVVVPMLHGIFFFIIYYTHRSGEFAVMAENLPGIRKVLVWSGIAAAHIFFVALLVNGLAKKTDVTGSNDTEQGLFDDIVT